MYQFDMQLSQVLAYSWHASDGTDESLSADFNDQATASFWLMDLPAATEVDRRHLPVPDSIAITRERAIVEFRGVFLAAIDYQARRSIQDAGEYLPDFPILARDWR
jgi:hypothetical protein